MVRRISFVENEMVGRYPVRGFALFSRSCGCGSICTELRFVMPSGLGIPILYISNHRAALHSTALFFNLTASPLQYSCSAYAS